MSGFLCRAFGYQGNAMNLPVGDVASASTYYQTKLGFRVRTGSDTSHRSVVLTRDAVEMQLIENGGDPSQDGCAFHVTDVESLLAEFQANGVNISGLAGRAAEWRYMAGLLRRRAGWLVLLVWREGTIGAKPTERINAQPSSP